MSELIRWGVGGGGGVGDPHVLRKTIAAERREGSPRHVLR